MWTIGLALSGAPAGLTQTQYAALDETECQRIRERVTATHRAAGAHYVIDSVADLLPVLDDIERRLQQGERP